MSQDEAGFGVQFTGVPLANMNDSRVRWSGYWRKRPTRA